MKCNNCGFDLIADNATRCPRCAAPLTPAGWQGQPAPQQNQQYQAPPQQQYQPPQQYQQQGPPPQQYQQQGYYQQPPMPPKRMPTVRKVNLTEVLFILSGFLLIAAGFDNLSGLRFSIPFQYVLLGIVALLFGLLFVAMVVMPNLLKGMDEFIDIIVLVLSIIFVLWGLAALFANNVGWSGSYVTTAGLAGLMGGMLKMGILK